MGAKLLLTIARAITNQKRTKQQLKNGQTEIKTKNHSPGIKIK